MYELYPYFTNDGSVGLYSPRSHDVYHSAYGALSEAYEKFILPAELMKTLEIKSNIKVLDICYGIGYNTKSFLNFILEYLSKKNYEKKFGKIFKKNNKLDNSTDAIDTDNNIKEVYNEQLYTDNVLRQNFACNHHEKQFENSLSNYNFYIKAIDVDKNLFFLSPFFKNGNKADRKHNKLNFHYEKISKFLEKDFNKKYKLKNEVNIILLLKIIENNPEILENDEIIDILNSSQYAPFFDPFMKGLFRFYKKRRSINTYSERLGAFLHNIYYRYVSTSYKKAAECLKDGTFTFDSVIEDARTTLKSDNQQYDYIFVDAFAPVKCPSLWTVDFFKLLFERLEENGKILTYTNSSAVKNAFINAGFHVGKIYDDDLKKFTGTIAVKNKSLIKNELTEYDLGLIKSKAGIFYRDEGLNASDETIIARHEIEFETSELISSSKYIKQFRRNNEI